MVRRSLLQAAVVLLVVLTLSAVAVGSVGAGSGQAVGVLQTDGAQTDDAQTDGAQTDGAQMDDAQTAAEQRQSHENPAEATESEEEGIEAHLESILSDRLADATDDATDGDYDEARELLAAPFDSRLDQYAEVAGDDRATLYEDTRSDLQEFIDASEQFDDRQDAYREARQDGDTDQADELRDLLEDDATALAEDGDELISSYQTLENEAGIDHSEEIEQVESRQQAADRFVSRTEGAGLVTTVLLVETDRTTIRFDEPARINGQLRTADGMPVADREITVAVEGRTYSVETDSAGQFEITHRPVESVGETTLAVEYRPEETSEYRATQREIPVTIEQVDAAVQIEPNESAASFERNLTTEGTVVAGDLNQPVSELPVGLFLDGEQLATTDTNETGAFSFSTVIPRSVDSGTAEIEVRTVESDGAISMARETSEVRIEPVSTHLTIETAIDERTAEGDPETADITGRLETADGQPIPDAAVDLMVAGETVETVTTADDGTFDGTITVPNADTTTVGASFSADGGHLEPTTETVTVESTEAIEEGQPAAPHQDAEPATQPALFGLLTRELLLAAGSLLALFGLVGLWWVRRDGSIAAESSGVEGALAESTAPGSTGSAAADSSKPTPASSRELRSAAKQQLDAGAYDHAVVLAYAAVRRRFGSVLETPDAVTHRELARSYTASEADHDHREAFEGLTKQYETVRYAADPVDEPTAVGAVSAAEQILDELEQPDHDSR